MHTTPFPSLLLCFLLTLSALSSAASSRASYPVGDQLPLIARVGQPYSWSISPETFGPSTDPSSISVTSSLPSWLSFSNLTFSGTPEKDDERTLDITLSGPGGIDDSFKLYVTHLPAPTLEIPLENQFNGSNPSMSSVFFLKQNEALKDNNPAVRIPLRWSFSIGFEYTTFRNKKDETFYYAQLANGSRLPDWLKFDSNTVTFNGVTKSPPLSEGDKVEVVFIASDQPGYSGVRAPFDIIIGSHDIESSGNLSLNVTAGDSFEFNLREDSWFFDGVTIDNSTLQSDNLTSLTVDTSEAKWISYDPDALLLSGTAPDEGTFSLPMTLSTFNESLTLSSSITVLPSYFTELTLPGAFANPDTQFNFELSPYFSNNSAFSDHDISISANSSVSYLNVDSSGRRLTGRIPSRPDSAHIDVKLTAYDHSSHTASHATLRISFRTATNDVASQSDLSKRKRLVYGLSIGLGGAAAIILVLCGLAIIRKCCRVPDSAVGGITNEKTKSSDLFDPDLESGEGGGWTEKAGLGLTELPQVYRPNRSHSNPRQTPKLIPMSPTPKRTTKAAFFNNVKAAVRDLSSGRGKNRRMPGMRKSTISKPVPVGEDEDSMQALRAAAGLEGPDVQPYVSAPSSLEAPDEGISLGSGICTTPTSSTGHDTAETGKSVPRQRAGFGPPPTGPPPRAPPTPSGPRMPPQSARVHVRGRSDETQMTQTSATGDILSDELAGAVIGTASRAPSIHSMRSSAYSYNPSAFTCDNAQSQGPPIGVPARPRLVQFTSERGVPSVVQPSNLHPGAVSPMGPRAPGQRRMSQVAAVVSPATLARQGMALDAESDAILNEGMRYVRAFGDQPIAGGSAPPHSASKRSSRSTQRTGGMSSNQTHTTTTSGYVYPSPSQSIDSGAIGSLRRSKSDSRGSRGSLAMSRVLVRTNERFSFKYPVSLSSSGLSTSPPMSTPSTGSTAKPSGSMPNRKLVARPLYGGRGARLPQFLLTSVSPMDTPSPKSPNSPSNSPNKDRGKRKRERFEVEFWGTPGARDIGVFVLGIFVEGSGNGGEEECVGKLVVEVVALRR